MSTTLASDEVASKLHEMRSKEDRGLKTLADEASRRGRNQLHRGPRRGRRVAARLADLSRRIVGATGDVADVPAVAEGDSHR